MARALEPRDKTEIFIQGGLPDNVQYVGPSSMKRIYHREGGQFKAIGWMTMGYLITKEFRYGFPFNLEHKSHDIVVLDTDL